MVSRNTSVLLAVAIIAIGAVAIIGVAYAYTASTQNTDNTSGSEYIILSQGDTAVNYTGAFNGTIKYDTVKTGTGTTYTLNQDQLVTILTAEQTGAAEVKAICLGEKTITVSGHNNTTNFKFSVANKTADGMTGTFYIGIKIDGGTEHIRAFTSTTDTTNYYKETSNGDHAAIVAPATATAIDDETASITVKMYLAAMDASASVPSPLNDVTFEFKAVTVTA